MPEVRQDDEGDAMTWGGRKVRRLRALVVATYGHVCHLCRGPIPQDLPADHPLSLTLDHLVPRSRGGTDELDNLRPAHRRCNLRRRDSPALTVAGTPPTPRAPEKGAGFFRGPRPEAPPAPSFLSRNP